MIVGWGIGALEIVLFFLISGSIRFFSRPLHSVNPITYYWLCMTTLTGIWEATYLTSYNEVVTIAQDLINTTSHVWTNHYSLSYVIPTKLARIFYAEYGAWADREYMSTSDDWSHTIEGTHAIFCAVFAFIGLLSKACGNDVKARLVVAMGMAFQLMNSILYMIEYGIQTKLAYNVNYNNDSFPLGYAMLDRPFMYVNVFWLVMPTFIMAYELYYYRLGANDTTYTSNRYIDETEMEKMLHVSKSIIHPQEENTPPPYEEYTVNKLNEMNEENDKPIIKRRLQYEE